MVSIDYFDALVLKENVETAESAKEKMFSEQRLKEAKRKRKVSKAEYIPRMEDFFATQYQYILFSILMANDSSFIHYLFTHSLFISGGAFLLIYITTIIFIGIPIIYVEIFLGRYTKKSNSQMYRMSPLFLGFCVSVLIINIFYQAKKSSEYARFIIQFLDLFADKSVYERCENNGSSWCYDYKIKGKIDDKCVASVMGMNCTSMGLIAYPYQYAYYNTYGNNDNVNYPKIKIFIVIGIIWFFVWLLLFRGLRGLGVLLNITFILQFIVFIISFIIIFTLQSYEDGFYHLLQINYSNVKYSADIWLSIWLSIINLGLVIPSGYMTFAAYSTTSRGVGMNCMIITVFIALYGIFMTIFFYCLSSTLANIMGCCFECVVVPGRGIYQAMLPELFSYVNTPFIFIFFYHISLFLNDLITMSICYYGIILGLFDFFPKLQNFRLYVCVISCILMAGTSMGLYGRLQSVREWMPVSHAFYTEYIVGLCVNIEAIMYFYVYGISRLTDDILFFTGEIPVKFLRVMWALIPVVLFICNVLMWLDRHLINPYSGILKNNEDKIRRIKLNVGLFYLAIFSFGLLASVWYYLLNLEKNNFVKNLLKPQYNWGPPDKKARLERKHFYPRMSIRSQVHYPKSNKILFVSTLEDTEEPVYFEIVEDWQTKKGKMFETNYFFSSIGVSTFFNENK